ncbi:N-succinylarginine dihydrolase [Alkalimarinus alittae]|uniref:N-succinylarginine dihydrolase n=1 Tax=Alkalimarinus alittae TaxID=2961619 RepID=A0ABY6N4S4_9ALTE|nr:N-succinylarginine dihydrolase [Alkalimarinus alittae]UZE97014.1 N-succinylarginine dihydrolase [Alkalimarinus alittae]
MAARELNFDGLVGPTHNYSGLSYGNVASEENVMAISNPKEAAKQGLKKMKALQEMGFKQGVLAPHHRPNIDVLRRLGFTGSDEKVLSDVNRASPVLLAAVSSASCMWTANAVTVSPSADTLDQRVHFTAANLNAKFHRSIEHELTSNIMKASFSDARYFAHHDALPSVSQFGDEGAANHTRFCADYGSEGVEFFVYGRRAFEEAAPKPNKYPARQTLEASEAIARLHHLPGERVVYAQQKPSTIDAGVFHNDVISVGNGNVLFYHEEAFSETERVLSELDRKLKGATLNPIKVSSGDVTVDEAVRSYLFNSQLLTKSDGSMMLVVPSECKEVESVTAYLDQLVASGGPIDQIEMFDLKQSMRNGGGPACLRLRVVLTENEQAAVNPNIMMSDHLFITLNQWVDKHYRDRLTTDDLADSTLLRESETALDELTQILKLGSVYPFQK